MFRNKGITFKLSLFILLSCSLVFIAILVVNYYFLFDVVGDYCRECLEYVIELAVSKTESILIPVEKASQSAAALLEHSTYTEQDLINSLKALVADNRDICGAGIAFEPGAFDRTQRHFAPYCYKDIDTGKLSFTFLGNDSYDYFRNEWYRVPGELKRSVWSDPYSDPRCANRIISTYSVPFYKRAGGKREFRGVIFADVSLDWLQKVSSITIGKTGYGFLLSRSGRIINFPIKHYIIDETIFSLAEKKKEPQWHEIGKKMIEGKKLGTEEFDYTYCRDLISGKESLLMYRTIPSNGWSLGIVFTEDEWILRTVTINLTVFSLGVIGFILLFAVIVLVSRSITKPLRVLSSGAESIAGGNLDFELNPIKSKDEIGRLTDTFIHMRDSLKQYIDDLTRTTAAKERIESELQIAHDLQMSMVPAVFPTLSQQSRFDIYALLKPAREVGGDFYTFFPLDDDHMCFVIGDVSGKGVPAALLMSRIMTLIKIESTRSMEPDVIIARVNREFCEDNDALMFVTIFFGVLDVRKGEFTYTNSGHNPPLLMRADGSIEIISRGGCAAVGLEDSESYCRETLILHPHDTIVLYTDGVTEAGNATGGFFSLEGLKSEVSRHKKSSLKDMADGIYNEISAFSKDVSQSDDITLMVIRFLQCGQSDS